MRGKKLTGMDRDCQDKKQEESIRALHLKFKNSTHLVELCFYPAYPVHPV
jgi:hypothetical protein